MKINSGFRNLSNVNFAAQVELIITSLTGNANFPEPWPSTVPALAQLQTNLASFQSALNEVASGDRRQIINRNTARQTLAGELSQLALYLQTAAQGDGGKLASTGFPLRQESPRATILQVPSAPGGLQLAHGPLSGSLMVKASRVPKAGAYEVQTTTADPTVEANWMAAGSFKNCGHIELDGLTPGKVVSVRLRAIGAAGPGAWTPATSLMVM